MAWWEIVFSFQREDGERQSLRGCKSLPGLEIPTSALADSL